MNASSQPPKKGVSEEQDAAEVSVSPAKGDGARPEAAALEKEGQELRASLTDRLALADLFAEVSLRLKNEFKVPAKK